MPFRSLFSAGNLGSTTTDGTDSHLHCGRWDAQIRYYVNQIITYLLILSIVGAALTILTFVVFRNIRTYAIKLIMYLCVCIVIAYIGVDIQDLDGVTQHRWLCIIVAFTTHYFLLADFCWTFCIAFNFFQMIVKKNRDYQLLEKWYHLGAWGVPAVIVLVVGLCFKYGKIPAGCSNAVCYITDENTTFGAFFVPGIIIITVNIILFFLIYREIQETLAGAPKTDQRDRRQEFRVYLSIFVSIGISWVFGYIEASVPQIEIQIIFFIIFSFVTPAQGILIFLSQCVNAKVATKWAQLFGKIPGLGCFNTLADKIQKSTASTTASRSAQSRSANSSVSRGS